MTTEDSDTEGTERQAGGFGRGIRRLLTAPDSLAAWIAIAGAVLSAVAFVVYLYADFENRLSDVEEQVNVLKAAPNSTAEICKQVSERYSFEVSSSYDRNPDAIAALEAHMERLGCIPPKPKSD